MVGWWGWFKNTYAVKFQLWWQQLKSNISFFVDIKGYKKGARWCIQSLSPKLYKQRGYIPFSSSLLCLPHLASPIQTQYIVYVLCSNLKMWLYFGFFFYKEEKLHWKTFNSFKKTNNHMFSALERKKNFLCYDFHPISPHPRNFWKHFFGIIWLTLYFTLPKLIPQRLCSNWRDTVTDFYTCI